MIAKAEAVRAEFFKALREERHDDAHRLDDEYCALAQEIHERAQDRADRLARGTDQQRAILEAANQELTGGYAARRDAARKRHRL